VCVVRRDWIAWLAIERDTGRHCPGIRIDVLPNGEPQPLVTATARRLALVRHPRTPAHHVRCIEVLAGRDARGGLRLDYRLNGDCAALRVPGPAAPVRRDGLWRHTCFEAFVTGGEGTAYREFNFSPSGEWAAYGFPARRRDMQALRLSRPPRIELTMAADTLQLRASVARADLPFGGVLRVGLAVVIEDTGGVLSYFSLAHTAAEPDFHDPASFTLRLPAA